MPPSLALCASLVGVLMLAPGKALGQINDTEGDWKGTLSCGALKIKSTRAGPAYSHPLLLRAMVGSLSGQRDTASTHEKFTGSFDRSGKATLQGSGAWRDDPARSWRFRLQGQYQGAALRLDGFMESSDGKIRLRDCGADLTQVRPVTSSLPPVRTSPPTVTSQTTKSTPPPTLPATHVDALAQQKKQKQQKEAEELAAQVAREKALAEKVIAEKALADKAIADKAVADKAQADKVRQDQAAQAAQQAAQLEAARLAADKALADKRALEIKNREAKKETIKARSSMDL